jgi:hypothetical protein
MAIEIRRAKEGRRSGKERRGGVDTRTEEEKNWSEKDGQGSIADHA